MLHGISIHVQNWDKGGTDMAEGGIREFEPEAIFSFWFFSSFLSASIYNIFAFLPPSSISSSSSPPKEDSTHPLWEHP